MYVVKVLKSVVDRAFPLELMPMQVPQLVGMCLFCAMLQWLLARTHLHPSLCLRQSGLNDYGYSQGSTVRDVRSVQSSVLCPEKRSEG